MPEIDLRELAIEVKEAYSMQEILDICGINYRKSGNELRTSAKEIPFLDNGENKTRVIFYTDSKIMWDTSTDPKKESLDLISVYAKANNIKNGTAIVELAQKKGLSVIGTEPENLNNLEKDICRYNNTLFEAGFKDIKTYLNDRGYSDNYLKDHKIGFRKGDKRIVFPYIVDHRVVYFIARKLPEEVFKKVYPNLDYKKIYFEEPKKVLDSNGQPKTKSNGEVITYTNDSKYKKANVNYIKEKYQIDNFYNYAPYNYDSVTDRTKVIYLCEGIPDSDTLTIAKKPNLCITSTYGTNDKGWNELIIPKLKKANKVIILGDNDWNKKDGKLSGGGIPSTVEWVKDYLLPNKIFNFEFEIIPRTLQEVNLNDPYLSHFEALKMTEEEFDKKYPEDIRLKDINEYYIKNGYSLNGLERTRINGFTYLARYYYTIYPEAYSDYFIEEIIEPIARHLTKAKAKMILNSIGQLEGYSDEKVLDNISYYLNNPPEESEIVNEIISENNLIYNDNTGFYLFNGKIWEQRFDTNIRTLISNALGDRFKKGGKLKPINELIKCDDRVITDNIDFNKKDIVVFNNGTLYLGNTKEETIFKENEFNPEDRMTFKSNYNYDPKAWCPNWVHFLNDALEVPNDTGDTFRKVRLAQEFTGYILFSDCRLEKFLILLGDGGNGKTTFFETIQNLFCEDSTCDITVNNFKRQVLNTLKDKILNISGESKSSLFGSEEIIKTLVSGSKVSDDPKFKGVITFKPRAKLIVCGNNDFSIEDSRSDGIYRRVLFLEFNNKYTDDKEKILKNPNKYHAIDIDLKDKLAEEMPGIFNWALEGYYRLKKNKKFTLPHEHSNKLGAFKFDNNPVLRFMTEKDWRIATYYDSEKDQEYYFFTVAELFSHFDVYCENNGIRHSLGKNNFGKEVKRLIEEAGIEVNHIRKRVTRGGVTEQHTFYYFTENPMEKFFDPEDY